MFSLIRDVLMPAASAVVLIGTLLMAPSAEAQEGPNEEAIAVAAAALLVAQVMPGGGTVPAADGDRPAASAEEIAADTPDARQCRRIERIGKVTIRRCQ